MYSRDTHVGISGESGGGGDGGGGREGEEKCCGCGGPLCGAAELRKLRRCSWRRSEGETSRKRRATWRWETAALISFHGNL
ncbi:hypothetical protein NL676_023273 [Syzygium grande]|nr:hypothetical protein NL676_023273 [Syzygium grande]